MKNTLLVLLSFFLLGACKDDPVKPAEEDFNGFKFTSAGTLNININHTFKGSDLKRNTSYITAAEDTISIEQLRYYLSNVQLKNTEGIWVNLGNYNLVDIENTSSQQISISGVPAGTYHEMRFFIGVDSVANSSGAQEGALSPANDMFWSWNTGYIFFRLKGAFNRNNPLSLDIGGIANLPVLKADLTLYKKQGGSVTINAGFDLADVFETPVVYSLKTMPSMIHTASDPGAPVIRDNIQAGAFTFTSIQ